MEKIEKNRKDYASMSDDELHAQMHQSVAHSEMHLAAKRLLGERQKIREQLRFHLVFWPSLTAAIIAVLAYIFT